MGMDIEGESKEILLHLARRYLGVLKERGLIENVREMEISEIEPGSEIVLEPDAYKVVIDRNILTHEGNETYIQTEEVHQSKAVHILFRDGEKMGYYPVKGDGMGEFVHVASVHGRRGREVLGMLMPHPEKRGVVFIRVRTFP